MINPESAAPVLALVARDLNPFTSPDSRPEEIQLLQALSRSAAWIANIAGAEARRREYAAAIAEQVRISRDGVEAERATAQESARRLVRLMRKAELEIRDLMESRPMD